ncbi:MAG: sigma-70 family RNA polymerase sigma factor [Cellulomonas sp.]|nr:sigma-70 family RNA polymerase sigma factor [Cellulomonas sp.]
MPFDPLAATDAELVVASLHTPSQFGLIFDRHAASLLQYAARRVDRSAAEDALSETFLVAFGRRASFDPGYVSARPWLYGIMTNQLRRHARQEKAHYAVLARTGLDPIAPDHADDVVLRLAADDEARTVARCLARLSTRDREVLLLHAQAGLTYDEIAQSLAIPVGTVRSRLSRARAHLHTALAAGGSR